MLAACYSHWFQDIFDLWNFQILCGWLVRGGDYFEVYIFLDFIFSHFNIIISVDLLWFNICENQCALRRSTQMFRNFKLKLVKSNVLSVSAAKPGKKLVNTKAPNFINKYAIQICTKDEKFTSTSRLSRDEIGPGLVPLQRENCAIAK